MTELYETKKPYAKPQKEYFSNNKNSIDYLLPEWVSVLKKYFTKYDR